MSTEKRLLFLLFILFFSYGVQAQTRKWEVFEITLKAKRQYQNPYAAIPVDAKEDLVQVHFSGTGGEAKGKKLVVFGFWDGGQNWKVRFAPPS